MGGVVSALINFPGCCQSDSATDRDSAGEPPLSSNDKLNIAADSAAEFLNPKEVREEGSGVLTIIVKEEAVPKPSTLSTESASLQGQLDLDNSRGQLGEIEPPSYVGLQAQEQTDQNELYQEIAEETPAQAALSVLESELKILQGTVNTLKRELQEMEASNASLLKQVQTRSAENSNLQQELQGKAQLQSQLQATEAERLALSRSVVALMAEKAEQENLQGEITEKMSAQADELSALRAGSKAFQEQLSEANTKLDLANTQKAEKEQLRRQLLEIKASQASVLAQVQTLSVEKSEIQATLQQETEKRISAEAQLSSLGTAQLELANSATGALQGQLEASRAEIRTLTDGKATLEAQLQQQEGLRVGLQITSSSLREQLDSTARAKEVLQGQLQAKEIQNRLLLESVAALSREKAELQAQVAQKETEKLSAQSDFQQRLTAAQSALQTLATDKKELKEKLEETQSTLATVTASKKQLEESSPVKNYYTLKEDYRIKTEQLNHPTVKRVLGIR